MTPFLAMTKVERIRHSRHAPSSLCLSCSTPYLRHTSPSGSDSSAMVTPCLSRKACRLTVCMSASGSAKNGAGCPGCSMCADSMPNHFSFDNCSLHACRASATRQRSYNSRMTLRLLGGLTPRTFLHRYWQKLPLFVRGALPAFRGVVAEHALAALGARDDVESRLVERSGKRWNTAYGPFKSVSLKKANSTLLVSGVNLHVEAADQLLRRFEFVPQARLDDVMVSFATRGGGVGPHVDSYDVFLVQGA